MNITPREALKHLDNACDSIFAVERELQMGDEVRKELFRLRIAINNFINLRIKGGADFPPKDIMYCSDCGLRMDDPVCCVHDEELNK